VLALRSARLFPGGGLPLVSPALVLIERGVIVDVDSTGASPPAAAEFLDLRDVTLLPGLIDSHVHLCFWGSADLQVALEVGDASLLDVMDANARQDLAVGVTTVRDLGDRGFLGLKLRRSYASGQLFGPEVLVAGPPITRSKGHFWFLGGEADGVEAVGAAVTERANRGCDVVKIMATGGFSTAGFSPHDSQYGPEELAAVVREAHRRGLLVASHAHGTRGITESAQAGVDSIEHCTFSTGDRVEVDWTVVEQLVSRGTFVGMTLALLPQSPASEPLAQHVAQVAQNLPQLHDAGLNMVCSSDAGTSPLRPHGVLPHGIMMLSRNGFTNAEAIESATSLAAAACGLSHRKGRVMPGFDADLLAIEGDPLIDIEALLAVRAVFRAGVRAR
jgi:imidazolonepropionase-like amidohydrolase